jgi:hypothetical protein
MKQVYSYQEVAPLIERGQAVCFTTHLDARVTAIQPRQDEERVTVTITLSIRDSFIGTVEQDFPSICAVLDTFDIDVHALIWEAEP